MTPTTKNNLGIFTLFTFAHMLFATWGYLKYGLANGASAHYFNGLAWLGYSLIYTLLALLPAYIIARFNSGRAVALVAILMSVIGILFIRTDSLIYEHYNFHINGFVWNLVTTKGGIESLGSDNSTYFAIAISVIFIVSVQTLFWWLAKKNTHLQIIKFKWRYLVWALLPTLLAQQLLYGIADIKNQGAVLDSAYIYPLYKKMTFRGLAKKIGFKATRQGHTHINIDSGRIQYPLRKIDYASVEKPYNIVILAAESLRWDRLNAEIMPNSYSLAQKGQWFQQHYSSGNGTREGLFGMFYGLYGSYWSSFLHAEQSPILIDRLQALGYQLDLRTSAKFSYPEFNKTLFAKIPLNKLKEADDSLKPWQNDQQNARQLIDFIKLRDKSKPFMSFFFFESTHARYDFPESSIIATPYLKDVNYWGMSRESLKPKISEFKNRYTNAAHWVDVQIGRVLNVIEQQGLMENTIIIVTGDHGEEFMEKGFWGHNSSFVEEQTHTPMIVWWPGKDPKIHTQVTSHLDISTTLLQMLGAKNKPSDYSLGENIFAVEKREYIVVSDWRSIGVMSNNFKYRIPYLSKGIDRYAPTDLADKELPTGQQQQLLLENQKLILEAMKNTNSFLRRK